MRLKSGKRLCISVGCINYAIEHSVFCSDCKITRKRKADNAYYNKKHGKPYTTDLTPPNDKKPPIKNNKHYSSLFKYTDRIPRCHSCGREAKDIQLPKNISVHLIADILCPECIELILIKNLYHRVNEYMLESDVLDLRAKVTPVMAIFNAELSRAHYSIGVFLDRLSSERDVALKTMDNMLQIASTYFAIDEGSRYIGEICGKARALCSIEDNMPQHSAAACLWAAAMFAFRLSPLGISREDDNAQFIIIRAQASGEIASMISEVDREILKTRYLTEDATREDVLEGYFIRDDWRKYNRGFAASIPAYLFMTMEAPFIWMLNQITHNVRCEIPGFILGNRGGYSFSLAVSSREHSGGANG